MRRASPPADLCGATNGRYVFALLGFLVFISILNAFPILTTVASILLAKVALECQRRGLKTNGERFYYALGRVERGSTAVYRAARYRAIGVSRWTYSYLTKPAKERREKPRIEEETQAIAEVTEGGLRENRNGSLPELSFRSVRYELPKQEVKPPEVQDKTKEYATPEDLARLVESRVFAPPIPRGRKKRNPKRGLVEP